MKLRNLSAIFFAALALSGLVAGRADAADFFPFQIPGLGAPAKGSVVNGRLQFEIGPKLKTL